MQKVKYGDLNWIEEWIKIEYLFLIKYNKKKRALAEAAAADAKAAAAAVKK